MIIKILALSACLAAMPAWVKAQDLSTTTISGMIQTLDELDGKMIGGLGLLKSGASEYADLARRIFVAKSPEQDELVGSLLRKFPARGVMMDVSLSTTAETNPRSIARAIDTQIDFFRKTASKSCFLSGSAFNVTNAHCKKVIDHCQKQNSWGGRSGTIYKINIKSDLNESEETVVLEDLWKSTEPLTTGSYLDYVKTYYERRFSFCKLASAFGHQFAAIDPFVYNDQEGWAKALYFVNGEKDLMEKCAPNKPTIEQVSKLYELAKKYPKNWSLKFWGESVNNNIKICRTLAQETCINTYTVKDRVILSYPTVGCAVREVTVEDVNSDIEGYRRNGGTQATILNHSTMIDTIASCQAASNAGYTWNYLKPDLGPDCKQKKQTEK